jgi:hypothetical protein
MTVDELITALASLPADTPANTEVFIRMLDGDGLPMFLLLTGVSAGPEGIMIEGGEEVVFTGPDAEEGLTP